MLICWIFRCLTGLPQHFIRCTVGGAHLDAYLALLVPIIGYWMVGSNRLWVLGCRLSTLLTGGLPCHFHLVTRTTFVVLVGEMILLIIFC